MVCILQNEAFGCEDEKSIATGLGFRAGKGNPIVRKMMTDYSDEHFLNEDGSYNKTTCPVRNTESISDLLPEKLYISCDVEILKNDDETLKFDYKVQYKSITINGIQ